MFFNVLKWSSFFYCRESNEIYFVTKPITDLQTTGNVNTTSDPYAVLLRDSVDGVKDKGLQFEYRPDPVIESIYPDSTFIRYAKIHNYHILNWLEITGNIIKTVSVYIIDIQNKAPLNEIYQISRLHW